MKTSEFPPRLRHPDSSGLSLSNVSLHVHKHSRPIRGEQYLFFLLRASRARAPLGRQVPLATFRAPFQSLFDKIRYLYSARTPSRLVLQHPSNLSAQIPESNLSNHASPNPNPRLPLPPPLRPRGWHLRLLWLSLLAPRRRMQQPNQIPHRCANMPRMLPE
jgi:hypothetical protein